ncbi:MAG: tRNA (guanosine(37)-N1)-methyltransferase TrmD [Candidatus Riflebacteria bacterium]|nr:tRNA (guanosine(37)-N1)-methyltransferase TrmD [Candidatus Riflebacteria bacterium]
MRFDLVTIFPVLFEAFARTSIVGRAVSRGLVELHLHDLRDFSTSKHRTVDDYPFGGGAGMLMGPEPFFRAVESIDAHVREQGRTPHRVLLSPAGALLDQLRIKELTRLGQVTLLCGHYKGIDDRVETLADEELSIGDYVLSGGELPAMVLMDAVIRLLPGAVGTFESVEEDSHYEGLLGYPMYTRPATFRGLSVPEVLLSGHHAKIEAWRGQQAIERTRSRRPDLWKRYLESQREAAPAGTAAGGPGQEVEQDELHRKAGTSRDGEEETP